MYVLQQKRIFTIYQHVNNMMKELISILMFITHFWYWFYNFFFSSFKNLYSLFDLDVWEEFTGGLEQNIEDSVRDLHGGTQNNGHVL